ncbi:MAG: hypothetical protein ACHP84_20410 [Caulobacterales bacterium]
MTTSARAIANRANADRSTGPRTPHCKARSSKNALRHGLNVPRPAGESLSGEIEDLAHRLSEGSVAGSPAALRAAETQVQLVRIRNIKLQIVRFAIERLCNVALAERQFASYEIMTNALIESEPELLRLDGYERKARSRRKKALRALWE